MPTNDGLGEAIRKIGQGILTDIERSAAEKRRQQRDDEIRISRKVWDEYKTEVEALKARVERQAKRSGDLQRDKTALSEIAERQGHELDYLRNRVAEVERVAASRDERLGQAQAELAAARAAKPPTYDHALAEDDNRTIASLRAHVADLEAQQAADLRQIEKLTAAVDTQRDTIQNVRNIVGSVS